MAVIQFKRKATHQTLSQNRPPFSFIIATSTWEKAWPALLVSGEMSSSEERAPVVKYVGYKVAKVRWKPQPVGAIGASEIFASGSYEDEVGINQSNDDVAINDLHISGE